MKYLLFATRLAFLLVAHATVVSATQSDDLWVEMEMQAVVQRAIGHVGQKCIEAVAVAGIHRGQPVLSGQKPAVPFERQVAQMGQPVGA